MSLHAATRHAWVPIYSYAYIFMFVHKLPSSQQLPSDTASYERRPILGHTMLSDFFCSVCLKKGAQ
jgi:hypothetical protein